MNWMPIEGAPLDGAEVDLWGNGTPALIVMATNGIRIPSCRFMNGAWHRFDTNGDWSGWSLIEGWKPTHFTKITPPQVPLDWPDWDGMWWAKSPHSDGLRLIEITEVHGDCFFSAHHGRNYRVSMTGWKFLPAPIPSFGGD